MPNYYPPVSFHFRVDVLGLSKGNDVRFSEVSGLSLEVLTEEVAEGGENRFVQKYPGRVKYPELLLKRGYLVKSDVFGWIRDCVERDQIEPRNVDVMLLNEAHEPLVTWHVVNAFPTKWATSDLNASSNTVVIETLQLYYQHYSVDRS
ncbi:MAG TPA: phage tail protein [Vicinamibacterales bacterium]|nr:phage tail protein [Vicinamibacterales bacterium]